MKGFMKGCLWTILILLILGIGLTAVAFTTRGGEAIEEAVERVTAGKVTINLKDWKNFGIYVKDQVRDTFDSVDYEIGDSMNFDSHYEIYKGDVSKFSLGKEVENIEIEVGGCHFETKESGDDSFYIEAQKISKFQAYIKNSTLTIKGTNGAGKWDELSQCKVTLYIPAGQEFDSADISLGAGYLEFPGLCGKKVKLELGAGEMVLKETVADEFKASVGMGALQFNGDINNKMDVSCSMGDVELVMGGKEEDYNYHLSGAMGSLTLGDTSYSGFAQNKDIDNGADRTITLECSMGSASIQFR